MPKTTLSSIFYETFAMSQNKEYIKRAVLFYLFWVMGSFGGYLAGRYLAAGTVSGYIFIFAGLFSAALATRAYSNFIEPGILGNTRYRMAWLLTLACIFFGIYILVRVTNTPGNIFMALTTATLFLFACVLGHWLAIPLKRPAELLPVCLVVAFSDVFSVSSGPTKKVAQTVSKFYTQGMEGPPPLVDFFLIKFPLPGHDLFMPVFGVTDWIVVVLLSAAAAKFELNDNTLGILRNRPFRHLFFPVAGLGLALAVASAWLLNRHLPGLPFVSFFFITVMAIKYPQIRQLTRAEIRPTAIICLFILGLTVVLKMT